MSEKINLKEKLNEYNSLYDVAAKMECISQKPNYEELLEIMEKCINQYIKSENVNIRTEEIISKFLTSFSSSQYDALLEDMILQGNNITPEQIDKINAVIDKPNFYNINSFDDVQNFEEIEIEYGEKVISNLDNQEYIEQCYQHMKESYVSFDVLGTGSPRNTIGQTLKSIETESKDIVILKDLILKKAFNQSYFDIQTFMNKYSNNIEEFEKIVQDKTTVDFMKSVKNLLNLNDSETLTNIYNSIENGKIDLLETDTMTKKQYEAMYSSLNYKIKENDSVSDGKKTRVEYAPSEFFMTVSSFGGVFKTEGSDNYKERWTNVNGKTISTSFISNNNISTFPIEDVCFGFSDMQQTQELSSGKRCLQIATDRLVSSTNNEEYYSSPWNFIDQTKAMPNVQVNGDDNHPNINEKAYRRIDNNGNVVLPSYVVYFSNGNINEDDPIWNNSVKASNDFGIPIVVIDKERIVKKEVDKEKMIRFCNAHQPKFNSNKSLIKSCQNLNNATHLAYLDTLKKYLPQTTFSDFIMVAGQNINDPPISQKKTKGQLTAEMDEIFSQIDDLFLTSDISIKEKNRLRQITYKLYQKSITDAPEEISISINKFTKNALNSGVRTETVDKSEQQMDKDNKLNDQQKSLADLDDLIDFIDPNLIQDQRYLNYLRHYRDTIDLPPEQYVERLEKHYKEQYGKVDIEHTEETDETIR